MDKFYGVLFNRKSGKVVKTLEGVSSAMLKLFALQGNVSSARDYVVFNGTTGTIVFYCEGKKNDSPTICRDMEGKNINELAEGLLDALNAEQKIEYQTGEPNKGSPVFYIIVVQDTHFLSKLIVVQDTQKPKQKSCVVYYKSLTTRNYVLCTTIKIF